MANVVKHRTDSLLSALDSVVKAHQAVKEGIATHAQKHQVAVDARREKVRQDNAISAGISEHNQAV